MSIPKLSICIATYNRGQYIGETLDSILANLEPCVEIVIVDGASPDDTYKVMSKYVERYPQIKYFREKENSGVDADFDKAVGYAQGDYCWLMTDDDLLKPEAIKKVLNSMSPSCDLIIANAEIKTTDFSNTLSSKFLQTNATNEELRADNALFFSEVANYLSFIGGVIIRRQLWLEREREQYYGTMFVHVGVIFQNPPVSRVSIINDPVITIRYGNASWTSRTFEIWMFKWPELIWSFTHYSIKAKKQICDRYPWLALREIIKIRAVGGYSLKEYKQYLSYRVFGFNKLKLLLIALVPIKFMNALASLYCLCCNRNARAGVYNFAKSHYSTVISRWVAKKLGV